MARSFAALNDRIVATAPTSWPLATGTVFVKLKPTGWNSGDGTRHALWMYGFSDATGEALLSLERFSDNLVYAGWKGDGAHGGEQRVIASDAGCFVDGAWSSHVVTWDAAAGRTEYYADNALKQARVSPLNVPSLSGAPTSGMAIGNYMAPLGDADARGTLAFFGRWDRVLSAVERLQLQNGAHPLDLPTGLVECIELGAGSPEQDLQSAGTYSVIGTAVAPDPSLPRHEFRRLAKKFEPILLFHQDEKFFPIDPKWYLEQCALWPAVANFTDKANWGELPSSPFPHAPRIQKATIAALVGEAAPTARWLGETGAAFGVGPAPDREVPPPAEEFFLEFAGWEPVTAPPVTASTNNRHAALDPAEYIAPLATSRPWYYVEYLDNADLLALTQNRTPNGLDLTRVVATNPNLKSPRALLYYFLYPLHQESLEGCEAAGEGASFGTYGGEWSCVAVLLDNDSVPLFIGLTSRNVGAPSVISGDDRRVGMTVFPWTAVNAVTTATGEQHPKIFVSLGTHGCYPSPGPHIVTPFSGGNDLSRGSCGAVETLDDAIAGDITIPGTPSDMTPTWVMIVKFGILVLVPWGLVEVSDDHFGSPDTLVEPSKTPTDQTGGPAFGKIIRPNGLSFPETSSAAAVVDWQVERQLLPNNRAYDFVVNRPSQVWWTPRRRTKSPVEGAGWFGRWGPRVTNDPFNRRAGGKCPDFAAMFLEAIAIAVNQ